MLTLALRQTVHSLARRAIRHPGAIGSQVLLLSLVIACAGISFSVLYSTLLSPFPYPEWERLVFLWEEHPEEPEPRRLQKLDRQQVEALAETGDSFRSIARLERTVVQLESPGGIEKLDGARVPASLFDVLQIQPVEGRPITRRDIETRQRVALVSNNFRSSASFRVSADQGRSIVLGGEVYDVIGVLPPGVHFPDPETVLWLPASDDDSHMLTVARLRAGVSHLQAEQELGTLLEEGQSRVESLDEHLFGDFQGAIWALSGASALLWLLGSFNVAGLQVSAAAKRSRELAVRTALGATRSRLIAHLVGENLLLAASGSIIGAGLAWAGMRPLVSLMPFEVPRLPKVALTPSTLAILIGLALLSGFIAAFIQGIATAGRDSISRRLGGGFKGTTATGGGKAVVNTLVIAEIALAFLILNLGGMLTASFVRLKTLDNGFDPKNLLSFQINLPYPRYPSLSVQNDTVEEISRGLRQVRGVVSVGASIGIPLGPKMESTIRREDQPQSADTPVAILHLVDAGYFATLGIELKQGQWWDQGPPGQVAIISESLALALFQDDNPIGKRVKCLPKETPKQIVGVVEDVRHYGPGRGIQPEVYYPQAASPWRIPFSNRYLTVRFRGSPDEITREVGHLLSSRDAEIRLDDFFLLEERLAATVAQPRFWAFVLSALSLLGLLLAVCGIYAVTSHGAQHRRREIGIRMAIGASADDIIAKFLREAALLTTVGLTLGLMGTVVIGAYLSSLRIQLPWGQPETILATAAILSAVALGGFAIPAIKASRIDPMRTLKVE